MTGSYSELRALTAGTEYQVHHIVDYRFHTAQGLNPICTNYYSAPCVIVTKEQHQIYTNYTRASYPYGKTDYANVSAPALNTMYIGMYEKHGGKTFLEYLKSCFI